MPHCSCTRQCSGGFRKEHFIGEGSLSRILRNTLTVGYKAGDAPLMEVERAPARIAWTWPVPHAWDIGMELRLSRGSNWREEYGGRTLEHGLLLEEEEEGKVSRKVLT